MVHTEQMTDVESDVVCYYFLVYNNLYYNTGSPSVCLFAWLLANSSEVFGRINLIIGEKVQLTPEFKIIYFS